MQSLDRVHQSDLRLDLESLGRNPGIGTLTGIPGYSVHFVKFEGYFSCQWDVNSWQLLPPSFIIHLSLVPAEVRSSKKLPPPQDQERLSLQEKSQAGSARPPSPHLIAPLREKSSGFKTWKMQCERLSMNITLKEATTGKPKLRCWKARGGNAGGRHYCSLTAHHVPGATARTADTLLCQKKSHQEIASSGACDRANSGAYT